MRHWLRLLIVSAWLACGVAQAADLGTISITTAVTNSASTPITGLGKLQSVSLVATFTYTSGGTTAKVYVQTSFDGGNSWYDVKQFAFATAGAVKGAHVTTATGLTTAALTTGTMSDDAVQQGPLGDRLRYVITTVGTYGAGTKINVTYQAH